MKKLKIQQYHINAKSAREHIVKGLNDPHSSISRDYNGMNVSSVRVAKKVYNQPNIPVNGRRLFDITLTKRRK
jgi:hypothetical protein